MKTQKVWITVMASVLTMGISSQAALLAYEGFNTNAPVGSNFASTTAAGTYTTDMTGFGFASYTLTTGSWRWDYEDGQNYTDGTNSLVTAGRSIGELETFGNTRTIAFNLADPITNGTTYVSYLFNTHGLSGWGLEVGMDQGLIRSSGTGAMQFYDPSGAHPISTPFGSNETHLVVLKMDLDNNRTTVWVDPSDLTNILDTPGNFTVKDWSSSATGLSNFWVQAGGNDTIGVDEIRIGTTLGDVITNEVPPVAVNIVEYQMNDVAGTTLSGLQQDGWATGGFSGSEADIITDGNGNLSFTNASGGNAWKSLEIGTDYTSGQHVMEWRIDAWDLSSAPHNSGIAWGLYDSGGTAGAIKNIRFQSKTNSSVVLLSSEAWVPLPGTAGDGGSVSLPLSSTTGIVVRANYDIDAGLYSLDWKYDTDAGFSNVMLGSLGSEPDFNRMQLTVFKATAWGVGQQIDVDYLTLGTNGVAFGAASFFTAWMAGYPGVGSSTAQLDDPDSDGVDNLGEYALGGNPDDSSDTGDAGITGATVDGGTNYLEYVYAKRTDAEMRGLTYTLEQTGNLVTGPWITNGTAEVLGTGSIDSDFDAVTNRVPTDFAVQQFLKVKVESSF